MYYIGIRLMYYIGILSLMIQFLTLKDDIINFISNTITVLGTKLF